MDQNRVGEGSRPRRRVFVKLGLWLVVIAGAGLVAALALNRSASSGSVEAAEDEWVLEAELDDAFEAYDRGDETAVFPSQHALADDRGSSDRDEALGGSAGGVDEELDAPVGVVAEPYDLPELEPDVFPEDRARLVDRPDAVRGLYFNAWSAGSSRRMSAMIDLASRTEINSFVLDVKDATGYVSYRTGVGVARQVGADQEIRIRDVRALLERLRESGVYPIARIVVFKDPLLAQRRPDLSIRNKAGDLWIDHHGDMWVDPYNREIWDYHIALAREAVLLGFAEVQWDYVRFPDVPQRYMREAVYPAREGRSREDAIREFLSYSRDELSDLGVPVTADVFGLTVSAGDDMGIGQRWSKMVDATDVILPMIYPSHFAPGSYGIPRPNAAPYETVKTALDHAVRRSGEGAAVIRPWLQDFTLGQPGYDAAHVRAQIEATYAAGIREWVLWNPGGRYTAEALATADGVVPDLEIPRLMPEVVGDTLEHRHLDVPTPRVVGEPVDGTVPPLPMLEPVRPIRERRDTTASPDSVVLPDSSATPDR